jgi:hypothetical protein
MPETMREFDQGRPKICALDLDGTLLDYDGDFSQTDFGPVLKGMIEELREMEAAGVKIVVWTCRNDTPELRAHLRELGVPFHYINGHPWPGGEGCKKLLADSYVDDRNIEFTGVPTGLAKRVLKFKPYWAYDPLGS